MIFSLENAHLNLHIDSQGAELTKLTTKTGREYLWNANPETWARHSPVLFPIVGKLINNTYKLDDHTYNLPQHGIARDLAFKLVEETPTKMVFQLNETENTLKVYPFHFQLHISYTLTENQVKIGYQVLNTGHSLLPFSIGAHPAFMLDSNLPITEYYLEFQKQESGFVHQLIGGLVNPEADKALPFSGNKLYLSKELFADDALIFSQLQSECVALVHDSSNYRVQVSTSNFPWLGIWAKDHVPFVCIEPWQGHADFTNHDMNFWAKDGVITLKPTESYSASFTISVA